MQVIGREDLLGDARFNDNRERYAHRDEVDEVLQPWVAQRTKREVMETLGRAGIPAGAVFDTEELMNDPFLRERGMFATVQHPVRGEVTLPGWPVKMSDSCVPVKAAPLLGQDNAQIYGDLLGLAPEQIEALHSEEAI
jgi:formyl-CoA transferase